MNIQNKALKTFLFLLIPKACPYPAFGSDSEASAYYTGDPGSVPGSGRSSGEGNGNPLQHSCWKIPWTEEPGGPSLRGHRESDTTERLHFTSHLLYPAFYESYTLFFNFYRHIVDLYCCQFQMHSEVIQLCRYILLLF